ncbi:MAG: (2Fe-2S)-binding protein [Planctomycetota bacterium]|nr:(2Fe-2S)-binding protein [Planctomycetota bacterium]
MIPDLPSTYVEHLVTPHGMGDVSEPHAAGEFGSMVGGIGVRISLAYGSGTNNGALIREARGRVVGSAGPLAPVSWLTREVEGRTYEAACGHSAEGILHALGGDKAASFPPAVKRGAEFAVKALRRALGIAVHGVPANLDGGLLVCRCIGVGDRTIRRAIRAGALDPEAIGRATGACTGCRSCRPDLMALLDDETRERLPPPSDAEHPVARVCMATAGPILRGLGLPLAGASVQGGVVVIRLSPPRADACLSPRGAIAVVRQLLRDVVAEDVRVELAE